MNLYATKKTAAEGMLDIALFLANITHMKTVIEQGAGYRYRCVCVCEKERVFCEFTSFSRVIWFLHVHILPQKMSFVSSGTMSLF